MHSEPSNDSNSLINVTLVYTMCCKKEPNPVMGAPHAYKKVYSLCRAQREHLGIQFWEQPTTQDHGCKGVYSASNCFSGHNGASLPDDTRYNMIKYACLHHSRSVANTTVKYFTPPILIGKASFCLVSMGYRFTSLDLELDTQIYTKINVIFWVQFGGRAVGETQKPTFRLWSSDYGTV